MGARIMVRPQQTEQVVATPPLGETIQKITEALEPYDKSTRRRIIESIKILMTDREKLATS